ncbi:MAG: type I restriction-modification system subunit M N-terminal domain-containing protein, partial [Isosphaeraceae bacterium]
MWGWSSVRRRRQVSSAFSSFEEKHAALDADRTSGADPEDPDEYRAVNIFWVPPEARWANLRNRDRDPMIGKVVDDAMLAIERDNPTLKG